MKPEMILHAELLDILFEDRNKAYGAYTLRKEYNGRLAKAMSATLGFVLLFVAGNYSMGRMNINSSNESAFPIIDSVRIQAIEIPKELIPPPEKVKKIATIQHTTPVIVQTAEPVKPPPTTEELDGDVQIGKTTEPGGPPTTLASQPSGPETEAPAAPVATVPDEPAIETTADVMPEFPGGNEALRRFLLKNLRFDFEEQEPGTRIEIRCRFVVDIKGNVSGAEIVKSAGKASYDKEVTRVVGKMPQWKPGIKRNRNVAVYFTLPVVVEIPEQ